MRSLIRLVSIFSLTVALAATGAVELPSLAQADMVVAQCQTYQPFNGAALFSGGDNTGGSTVAENNCAGGDGLDTVFRSAPYGYGSWWFINVPSGWLTFTEARVWYRSYCPQHGMSGEFAWNDYGQNPGTASLCGGTYVDEKFSSAVSSFGWRHWCAQSGGCSYTGGIPYPELSSIQGVWLDVHEGAVPTLGAVGGGPNGKQNLWWHGGNWVRGGNWPVDLVGGDITGVCRFVAVLDGNWIAGGGWESPDQSQWHQCDQGDTGGSDQYGNHQQRWSAPIDLSRVSDGWHSYQIVDQNAAGNWGPDPSEQIGVDNSPVSLSLSGPTNAPTTAGTQYVTARATAGPSGVGAINCSTGGGAKWTSETVTGGGAQTATARIPVDQLGTNVLRCQATNRAVDANDAPASSAVQTWTLHIGEPVEAHISLSRIHLRCREVRIHRHHHATNARRCALITHDRRLERVRYGRGVNVSGWVATAAHEPLAGVRVRLIAAADNFENHWHKVATVKTDASGRWQARLGPGPSRLVAAEYDGGPSTEGATSAPARVVVPARVRLDQVTTHVPWGGVLMIRGQVLGGYVPGGQILRVLDGAGGHLHVIANPTIRRDGRFIFFLKAVGGGGPLRVQVAVGTLSERDYPYAPGVSERRWVTIG